MFLPDSEVEREALRQGDIILDVQLIGALKLTSVQLHVSTLQRDEPVGWAVPAKPIYGPAAVLSHSCEIALENKIKVTSIILAPIRDLHKATDPSRIEEVKKTNLLEDNSEASFLKYFYLASHSTIPFPAGGVIDFSKCFSVRKDCYDLLLSKKVAQLTPEMAASMSLKLGVYFHRNGTVAA